MGRETYALIPALLLNVRIASLASVFVPEKEDIAFVAVLDSAGPAFAPLWRRSIIEARWRCDDLVVEFQG